jgi:hypothetical protein
VVGEAGAAVEEDSSAAEASAVGDHSSSIKPSYKQSIK